MTVFRTQHAIKQLEHVKQGNQNPIDHDQHRDHRSIIRICSHRHQCLHPTNSVTHSAAKMPMNAMPSICMPHQQSVPGVPWESTLVTSAGEVPTPVVDDFIFNIVGLTWAEYQSGEWRINAILGERCVSISFKGGSDNNAQVEDAAQELFSFWPRSGPDIRAGGTEIAFFEAGPGSRTAPEPVKRPK
jgi:hypothetical protein